MKRSFLLFLTCAFLSGLGDAAEDETKPVFDCGVNTLYLVLRLKDIDTDLNEISKNLARDAEKGSSIQDLENYLHSVGIKTNARLTRLSALCKKRGVLSILLTYRKDGTGHFVVARVLPTGQLQIIDSLLGSYINEDAIRSKESLPVILIGSQGYTWMWNFFAFVSLVMFSRFGWEFIKPHTIA